MEYLGKRTELQHKRKTALMPQAVVALKLGICAAAYSNIENGYTTPSVEVAEKLIKMFGLPEDYFYTKEEQIHGGQPHPGNEKQAQHDAGAGS